ncbi:MAG: sugar transferase [Planctomycetota bacterium]
MSALITTPSTYSLPAPATLPIRVPSLPTNTHPVYLAAKRGLDVVGALAGILLLSPVLLLVALLIKIDDGGPVFFTQTRVGKGGRLFTFFKFRSMCVDAEAKREALKAQSEDETRFKMKRDPRITWIGAWIRRLSIDELPQLFNVLRGDMTLVGPRPAIPEEVLDYTPEDAKRLNVEQGLTCLWQVGGRSLLDFEQQMELDRDYVRTRSLWLDLKLLVLTVPAVATGRGAY